MKKKSEKKLAPWERFARSVTKATGSTAAFIVAVSLIVVWAITGPFFHYSSNWQLVINTGTTIITFLMVFLIQKAQNKDSMAIQLKLDELVAAHQFASNRLVDVENMSEEELKVIQKYYARLSNISKTEKSLRQSHSIDEAAESTEIKREEEKEVKKKLEEKNLRKGK
jgi:low affinity Fe/Cu permease